MPNIIAIPYSVTIDTKKKGIIQNKENSVWKGDSILLKINITEDGQTKNITNVSNMTLIGTREDKTQVEQRDNIAIVNALNGEVHIHLKDTMINQEGYVTFQLICSDLDESFRCQQFVFYVRNASDSEIMEVAKDELSTLAELRDLISKYMAEIVFMKQKAVELGVDVDNEIALINTKISAVENAILLLEQRVKNANDEIYKLPSRLILTPVTFENSNLYYFETPVLTMRALDLLDCNFALTVKGKCQNGYIQSSTAICNFYAREMQNGTHDVYAHTTQDNNVLINSKGLNPSVVFSTNLSNVISSSTANFKILIKSEIRKDMNYVSEISSTLVMRGSKNLEFVK